MGYLPRESAQSADSLALNLTQPNRNVHKYVDERCSFHDGVPSVNVVRGVGFRDPE